MKKRTFFLLTVVAGLIGGCGRPRSPERPEPASGAPLTVYVAASMTDVMKELGQVFQAATGTALRLNAAGSGTLARQLDAGAPADLFVSANAKWMDFLEGRGLIEAASRFDLARNRLVLIAPRATPLELPMVKGREVGGAFEGFMAVGDFKSVPAGNYAKESLGWLGWLAQLEGRLVYGHDVRQVLMLVSRGEVRAGIVYATDARQAANVVATAVFPEHSHSPIVYPAAILKASANPAAAAFAGFLQTAEARAVLEKHGFVAGGKE